jgi:predicted Rossmann fold nucleotide-binding protein DprA/Smf involved in DNA uptake
VDLASFAYQIWKNATDADPNLLKIIPDLPNVIYATKKADNEHKINGAIVYTRTANENDILAWINQEKQIVTKSQFEILKAIRCNANEKPLERFEKHHELIKTGLEHIKETEDKIGGQLGRKTGARYKAYTQLDAFAKNNTNSLWLTDELKRAIQDILDYPLREYARETINRQLKTGISIENLAALVVSLREDDKLSLISGKEIINKEPQIICSMGLKVN